MQPCPFTKQPFRAVPPRTLQGNHTCLPKHHLTDSLFAACTKEDTPSLPFVLFFLLSFCFPGTCTLKPGVSPKTADGDPARYQQEKCPVAMLSAQPLTCQPLLFTAITSKMHNSLLLPWSWVDPLPRRGSAWLYWQLLQHYLEFCDIRRFCSGPAVGITHESQFSFAFLKIGLSQEDEGRLMARHKAPFEGPLKKIQQTLQMHTFCKISLFSAG